MKDLERAIRERKLKYRGHPGEVEIKESAWELLLHATECGRDGAVHAAVMRHTEMFCGAKIRVCPDDAPRFNGVDWIVL